MKTLLNGRVRILPNDSLISQEQMEKEAIAMEAAFKRTTIEFDLLEFSLILPGTVDPKKMDEFFGGTYYKLINSKGIEPGDAFILEKFMVETVNEHRSRQ